MVLSGCIIVSLTVGIDTCLAGCVVDILEAPVQFERNLCRHTCSSFVLQFNDYFYFLCNLLWTRRWNRLDDVEFVFIVWRGLDKVEFDRKTLLRHLRRSKGAV